jgi:hypothetical protein
MALSKEADDNEFERLFRMASVPSWIHPRDVCPVAFNRGYGNSDLSAAHCLNLAQTILYVDGFQDHRYNTVWLVLPNPDNPTELAVRANKARRLDKRLPFREVKPMPGAMNKNHLLCLLHNIVVIIIITINA